ncbi:hypothetical protein GCK32_016451, partial [Trichostrongylus colubriformis]
PTKSIVNIGLKRWPQKTCVASLSGNTSSTIEENQRD